MNPWYEDIAEVARLARWMREKDGPLGAGTLWDLLTAPRGFSGDYEDYERELASKRQRSGRDDT